MSGSTRKDTLVLTTTNEPPGLSVSGVLDIPDVDAFSLALHEAATRVEGNVSVDLSGLRAACAEGLLAMVNAARRLASEDRQLIARSLSTPQRQLLKLAGWDRAPGLVVAE
ncbi:STAS domain-containing protein [Actinocrinis puniceicyclus]|uniref:STAS domain-containing protein n=1 Tax=Actinocrinis puniceicyclus TaxID=977794 RepID=A0A8J7WP49_9ACTN|nr:STAS domain-containing protein [Actinocrinis puniceicyclus]MBS2963419.1 STAS domain-containing protein [Actinocrinis puniceicyclus]